MIRNILVWLLLSWTLLATAQNPSTVIHLPQKNIIIPCGTNCTAITATVPNIRQSDDYVVQTIPYSPYAYAAGGTELVPLYADDIYSSTINLPFSVCFYGINYNSLVVGSNGVISFDITNASKRNNFSQIVSFADSTPVPIPYAGGLQNTLSRTYYPKAAIMGVYHDIFPFDNGSRRIEWRIEGTAPKRRFIASYKDIPMFSCTDLTTTHQMVVYESTGVVEVYVQDKPVCRAWNGGLAILGIQNFNRNKAVFPEGKNASRWGSMGMNEAYRFTPSAGASKFKKAELLAGNTVVALADTASGTNGDLNLNFANVCPASDSVQYVLRVTYNSCTTTGDVQFDDTVYVKKEKLDVQVQVQNPTCTTGGSFLVNATGTLPSFTYSLNGGPAQTSNAFSDLPKGDYEISVSSATCTKTATATLVLNDDLLLSAPASLTVCQGETFTPPISSNGSSFQWNPSTGLSSATEASPQITAQQNMTYSITAKRGICESSTYMDIVLKPLPGVDAGPDQSILQGDVTQLSATAPPGTYTWTPANTLSSATILNPVVKTLTSVTYHLTVKATDGCTASDDVTVNVVPYCVKPMEAFTPNGDGINDLWLVTTGSCLKQAKVDVFNRYGTKVYHSEDYKNNWNGTYEGKPLPDGTYYFIITYTLINGKSVYLRGNVTILR
jgi:gliding motility-associated-like protein